jgi:hypothetical protein
MIKWLFRLVLLLVIGILIYNYFLGDKQEKEQSSAIMTQVKDLGKSLSGLIVSEKDKFDQGKYDIALDKVGEFIDGMRSNEKNLDKETLIKLDELERKQKALQLHVDKTSDLDSAQAEKENKKLRKELNDLLREADELLKATEKKN